MTQKQINSLNMFNAVLQYLTDNNTDWKANTLITEAIRKFSRSVEAINAQAAAQTGNDKKGYTAKKDQDLENLVSVAYKLALRIKNYAVSIDDPVLKQSVDFFRTELEAGKEKNIIDRCNTIVAKANSIVATAPAEYKITPELIAQVTAAAAAIEPDAAERDVVKGTHSGATTELNTLISTAKAQLHTLDDLIEGDADDDSSEFVKNYFIMRRTVDTKARGEEKKNDGKGDGDGRIVVTPKV